MNNLRPLLLASSLLLASCAGYTPLYNPPEGGLSAFDRVQVGSVEMELVNTNVGERRVAQRVSQRLRQDFPLSGMEMDTVTVDIEQTDVDLAIRRTATAERIQVTLAGHVQLTDPNGKTLLATTVSVRVPYNVEGTPYATETARTFARLTGAQNLAEEISRRLVLYYRQDEKQRAEESANAKPRIKTGASRPDSRLPTSAVGGN